MTRSENILFLVAPFLSVLCVLAVLAACVVTIKVQRDCQRHCAPVVAEIVGRKCFCRTPTGGWEPTPGKEPAR